jgi:hypothetical protein
VVGGSGERLVRGVVPEQTLEYDLEFRKRQEERKE